jgi:transcriptional regulator with XRE-family HTH domain
MLIAILPSVNEIQRLLSLAAARYPLQKDFADALGIRSEYLSRLLSKNAPANVSIAVESCLRLAELTGKSPVTVLRAAGKTDVADLLDRLFGVDHRQEVDRRLAALALPDAEQVLTALAQMDEAERDPLVALILRIGTRAPSLGQQSPPETQRDRPPAKTPTRPSASSGRATSATAYTPGRRRQLPAE